MKTCTCDSENTANAATALIDMTLAANRLGLKANEILVLAALVEGASLIDGEPNVAMSRYEIAKRTGISWNKAQRALSALLEKGLIGRRQNVKLSGETAVTVVSEAAYSLFGMQGGAKLGPGGLPAEFGSLVAGESESLIQALADAWKEGGVVSAAALEGFRGGATRLAQIEFLIGGRVEALEQEKLSAIQEAETASAGERNGEYRLALPDGDTVVFDQNALRSAAEGLEVAIRSADVRFARDVLQILATRSPERVTARTAPRLAAEILFSRQKGFVWKHDYEDACRVLASVIGRGTWKRPNRIDDLWYKTAAASIRAVDPQGVQFCAS